MRHAPRGRTTAATFALLAVLLPSTPAASTGFAPGHLSKAVEWSDAVVVGVLRDYEPPVTVFEADLRRMGLLFPRRTLEVEQWIAPAHLKSKAILIDNIYSKDRVGRRVLLLLRRSGSSIPSDHYSANWVFDLEDASRVAWELNGMNLNVPWIPNVSSTTSYPLTDWGDGSHPIKVPPADPRVVEIERVLKAALRQISRTPAPAPPRHHPTIPPLSR